MRPQRVGTTIPTALRLRPQDRAWLEQVRRRLGLRSWAEVMRQALTELRRTIEEAERDQGEVPT